MNEIATLQPTDEGQPLTAAQLKSRLALIQSVMRDTMQPDQDYGVIPGTQKPTLYKPGAEKLCRAFMLSVGKPTIETVPEYPDIHYRVEVPIYTLSGTLIAVGVGECSTGEEKYKWRRPIHKNEYDSAPEDQRRLKWQRDGTAWEQVRVTPIDVANTVLKMAHKRAYVHAVIMATAAGSIFTQDIEDLPEGAVQDETDQRRPPVQPPQRKSASGKAPAGAVTVVTLTIVDVTFRDGSGQNGPWRKFTIAGSDGYKYGTFDAEIGALAGDAKKSGATVEVGFKDTKYGRDIVSMALTPREPGGDDE